MTSARLLVAALLATFTAACSGYDDLPLPIRELGDLRVERVERFVEGPGVVQIALDPPNDAAGPFVVVGHPAFEVGTSASTGRVIAWAFGPCRGSPAPADAALRLCLAVQWSGTDPATLTVVVESRADARRFTLVGSEVTPRTAPPARTRPPRRAAARRAARAGRQRRGPPRPRAALRATRRPGLRHPREPGRRRYPDLAVQRGSRRPRRRPRSPDRPADAQVPPRPPARGLPGLAPAARRRRARRRRLRRHAPRAPAKALLTALTPARCLPCRVRSLRRSSSYSTTTVGGELAPPRFSLSIGAGAGFLERPRRPWPARRHRLPLARQPAPGAVGSRARWRSCC
ncbi:MAG: hypothetical protein U1F43_24260 [Myxococcota bacterium]